MRRVRVPHWHQGSGTIHTSPQGVAEPWHSGVQSSPSISCTYRVRLHKCIVTNWEEKGLDGPHKKYCVSRESGKCGTILQCGWPDDKESGSLCLHFVYSAWQEPIYKEWRSLFNALLECTEKHGTTSSGRQSLSAHSRGNYQTCVWRKALGARQGLPSPDGWLLKSWGQFTAPSPDDKAACTSEYIELTNSKWLRSSCPQKCSCSNGGRGLHRGV